MRYSSLLAVIVSFLAVAVSRGDEGLFSEVAMESVFAKQATDNAVASKNITGNLDRITGVSSLIEALEVAGYRAKETGGRATFELAHASWNFPVSLGVHVDRDRIDCLMSLVKIGDSASVTTQTLLKLLATVDRRGASFAYDPDTKMIQLRASFSNRSITASQLKDDLIHLASVAEKHADAWSSLAGSATGEAIPSQPDTQDISLVGRWSASLPSGEAFAIQITDDDQFQLVHLKSGKSTVSKGKSIRSGDQIKLVGDNDLTLNCGVTQTQNDAFRLAIQGADGKAVLTLDFKKAK